MVEHRLRHGGVQAVEAEERRANLKESAQPTEVGGRKGPDPTRYGDWEINGIAVYF
jgi:hypothetical protein